MIPTSYQNRPMVHLDHGPGKIHGYYVIAGRCRCSTCQTTGVTAFILEKYEPGVSGKPAMVAHSRWGHFRVVQMMESPLTCASVPCNGVHVTTAEMAARERETQTIGKVR